MRDGAFVQNALRTINIRDVGVKRAGALDEAALKERPFISGDHAGEYIQLPFPVVHWLVVHDGKMRPKFARRAHQALAARQ